MVLESYFDGANQANSTEYDVLALAAVSGTKYQWRPFEKQWKRVLKDHGAHYLHMTDALAYEKQSEFKGWKEPEVQALIRDCVKVALPHLARPKSERYRGKLGLFAYSIEVLLKDFVRARQDNQDVPKSANEICATQAVYQCQEWGSKMMRVAHYHLFFDQTEPFRGHIVDRVRNRKALRDIPALALITKICEANMRLVPALQLADLVGWSVSHKNDPNAPKWQRDLLKTIFREIADYEQLMHPVPLAVHFAKKWKLPKRSLHP